MIAPALLTFAGIYLAVGLVFGVAFVLVGAARIDPAAQHGSWGFRLLILPGSALLWPLLWHRWHSGTRQPPEEKNSHRCAARGETCS